MRRHIIAAAVLIALAVAAGVGAAEIRHEIDTDHGLDDESQVAAYDESGLVQASASSPQLNITIAESVSDCGVDAGLFDSVSDTRYHYLCLDYDGEVAQTTRLYIPSGYWHPYIRDSKEPLGPGPNAALRPVKNDSYTSVEVEFGGESNPVYAIPKDAAASYWAIERINDRTKSIAGISLWSSGTDWQSINASAFAGGPTVELKTVPDRTLVQYDATPDANESAWVPVPDGKTSPAPVYTMTPADGNQTVYVVSETDDPPPVRYRVRGTGLGRIDAAIDNLGTMDESISNLVDKVTESVGGLFGGS